MDDEFVATIEKPSSRETFAHCMVLPLAIASRHAPNNCHAILEQKLQEVQKLSDSEIRIALKTPPTRIQNRLQTGSTSHLTVPAAALEYQLKQAVKGEVRFSDDESRIVCVRCRDGAHGSRIGDIEIAALNMRT